MHPLKVPSSGIMERLYLSGSREGGLWGLLLGMLGANWGEWCCRKPSIPVRPAKVREEQLTASRCGFNPHRYLHRTSHIVYIHELFSSQKGWKRVGNVCVSNPIPSVKCFSMLSVLISFFEEAESPLLLRLARLFSPLAKIGISPKL